MRPGGLSRCVFPLQAATLPSGFPGAVFKGHMKSTFYSLIPVDLEALKPLAAEHGPTPQQVETPLADIPRDSGCYLFQNALRAEGV